jgi:hypothetical protein
MQMARISSSSTRTIEGFPSGRLKVCRIQIPQSLDATDFGASQFTVGLGLHFTTPRMGSPIRGGFLRDYLEGEIMSQYTKDKARAFLQSIAWNHLPSTTRRYSFVTYTGEPSMNALGIQADLSPQEGKVVEVTDDWIVLKKGRAAEFFITARSLVTSVPNIGATVRITPYARRDFNGVRLDNPKVEDRGNGVTVRTITIGNSVSKIPVDKASIQCPELLEMIRQLEELESPDGVRRLSQILVDAGAWKKRVEYKDPAHQEILSMPPTLRFRVESGKHTGYVDVVYDRGFDFYKIRLIEDISLNVTKEYVDVDFTSLGDFLIDAIDDGQWKLATVEVLRAAPKLKKAA